MAVRYPLMMILLTGCADEAPGPPTSSGTDPVLHIEGQAVTTRGGPFENVYISIMASELAGLDDFGDGYVENADATDGQFAFDAPPGKYTIHAAAGTCNGGVEVEGDAGETVTAVVELSCNG